MATVEIDTGKYVKRYDFWNPATWGIPKLYWDAYSSEQRIHAICRQLEKVIRYADYVGVNVDDIAQRLQDIEDGQLDDIIVAAVEAWFEEHASDITQRITTLENEIGDGFDSENTVSIAVGNLNTAVGNLNTAIEGEALARTNADTAINNSIDALSKRELVRANVLNAVADFRFDYQNDGFTGAQASCVFEIEGVRYYAVGLITGTVLVDASAYVRIYRLIDGVLMSTVTVGGHCNCITFHDGKLYVSGAATTQLVYIIDVSDPDNIILEDAVSFSAFASRVGLGTSGWISVTKIDDGYYIGHQSDGKIWKTDDDFENEILILTLKPRNVDEGVEQYLAYYPVLDMFAYVFADRVEWYDMTGALYRVTHFERCYNFCMRGEIEGISVFENGDFYFSNNLIATNGTQLATPFYISTLFKTNFETCDAPANLPDVRLGDSFGIVLNNTFDLIPNLDTAYVGYSRSVYLKSPGDIMAVYEQMGLNTCPITVQTDLTMPIVLTGVTAVLALNEHLVPGIYLAQARMFLYGHATAYASNDITMAFTDGGHPTFVLGRGAIFTCSGVSAKNGDRYLISNGFGVIVCPQATGTDVNVIRTFNNCVVLNPTNFS